MVEINMKAVCRVQLSPDNVQKMQLPLGAKFLHMGLCDKIPCAWFLVDPKAQPTIRRFLLVMTGEPITEEHIEFCGTIILSASGVVLPASLMPSSSPSLALHLFEVLYSPNTPKTAPSNN